MERVLSPTAEQLRKAGWSVAVPLRLQEHMDPEAKAVLEASDPSVSKKGTPAQAKREEK